MLNKTASAARELFVVRCSAPDRCAQRLRLIRTHGVIAARQAFTPAYYLRVGQLRHFIGARVGDEPVARLRALAEASGFTYGEILRRVLLSAEIPSARTRQEIQDLLRIQREQNRLGGLLKKALTEREEKANFAAPWSRSNATRRSSGASSHSSSAPDHHHAEAAEGPEDRISSLQARSVHAARKGGERCTWYMAGNLEGLDRREDAELAVEVMEVLQKGNVRAKGNRTYHLVISFHPEDRRLTSAELEDVVRRAVRAAGLEGHQYIAVRHSEQEHEHVHIAVNKIHPRR